MKKVKPYLICGAGLSGSTIARILADHGKHVIVIEKRKQAAGNCADYFDENNILVQQYGSHIFHTNCKEVWNFVNKFSEFNTYMHEVRAYIEGCFVHLPINLNSIEQLFPEFMAKRLISKLVNKYGWGTSVPIIDLLKENDKDLTLLSKYIYKNIFESYSTKQWGKEDVQSVISTVTKRVPVVVSRDNRYFHDVYQGIPLNGFSSLIHNLLDHPLIETQYLCEFAQFKNVIRNNFFAHLFYTGSIDEFYDYKFGVLPYRSVRFRNQYFDVKKSLPCAVVNYPLNYDFTRIHEFKYYLQRKYNDITLIQKEYSERFIKGQNDRFYPIATDSNLKLYNKYLEESKRNENVSFEGRLGKYQYFNMDTAVLSAMNSVKNFL